jgi:acyl-CoA dehydrogenase
MSRRLPVTLALTNLGPFFDESHFVLASDLTGEGMRSIDALTDPAQVLLDLGARELLSYLVPEALGGAAVGDEQSPKYIDIRSLALIRDALGQLSPLADALFAVQGLGLFPIVLAGSLEQREKYLPGALRGERIAAFALTEPEAGSDAGALRTIARRAGSEWILDGEKTLISNAPIAHHYIVFAHAEASPGQGRAGGQAAGGPMAGKKSITAFLVDGDTPGLSGQPLPMSIPHPLGTLRFDSCRLPAQALLGEVGGGYRLAMETLDAFRISVGAAANGMAARALACAVSHVSRRKQFGEPLADQQMVKAYLAEMATDLDAARLLVIRAAHRRDRTEERVSTEAAMAKMFATEAAQRIIDKAVQLHGGSGVLSGAEVERLYHAIRPLRIYEGTTEIQKLIIAKGVFERARGHTLDPVSTR